MVFKQACLLNPLQPPALGVAAFFCTGGLCFGAGGLCFGAGGLCFGAGGLGFGAGGWGFGLHAALPLGVGTRFGTGDGGWALAAL